MNRAMTAHLLAVASGLAMVAVVGTGTHGPPGVAAVSAGAAVVVAVVLRPVATLAVLLTVAVIALSSPDAALVGMSGLFAAVYLVLRHAAAGSVGLNSVSGATMVSAVGFTLVGVVATAFPLQLPWLPLLAPLAVFAIYLLATRPFLRDEDG
ncbi:integral membrane protein [Mycobacterium cookii]|uniref:Integral membrane protein n=1 Tax=Mycobacterium cookii TaxID=1775 RepID=A0A7I7L3N5_9MYCO|nr:hypothetical protein [Mycobacterium cookii]MCV7329554.1 hypothetical protein [Mycobacterium cookii]BBX48609.1 integral membrane protein [Mycobacterium cookii]